MIAVVMEPGCLDTSQWEGPVGGKLGGHLYINLSSDDGFDWLRSLDRLATEVRTLWLGASKNVRVSAVAHPSPGVHSQTAQASPVLTPSNSDRQSRASVRARAVPRQSGSFVVPR